MTTETIYLQTGDLAADADVNHTCADKALVGQLLKCVNETLLERMNQLLTKSDAHLKVLASAQKRDDRREDYDFLRTLLKSTANPLQRAFFIALNEKLKPHINKTTATEAAELSLVSEDEREEMVAMTTLHAHAMNQFGEAISHLETRLEYLEITSDSIFAKDDLNPMRICEIFQQSMRSINLEHKHRLIMFQLFEKIVTSELGGMYVQLNQLLIAAGIMPSIVIKSVQHDETEAADVTVSAAAYYDPMQNVARHFVPRTPAEINWMASRLMHGDFTVSENALNLPASFRKLPSTQQADGKQYFARKDVVKALSNLQRQIRDNAGSLDIAQIKNSLLSSMAHNGIVDKQVNLLDERSIDFVGMLFNAITRDESISKAIKNLLLRLQIPVIKAAMVDGALFQKDTHPTREVLNLVSAAGKGVSDEYDSLFANIEHIVDAVLDDYDNDIRCFDTAREQLNELIASEQAQAQATEREEQRRVVHELAREVVVGEIRQIAAKKHIPATVTPLVTRHWPSLMMNRYVRHGKNSTQWQEAILLIRLLIQCLQPIQSKSQWNMVYNNHLALAEAVNDELYDTRQDKTEIAQQIEALKEAFIALLDEFNMTLVDADTDTDEMTATETASAESTHEEAIETAANESDNILEDVASLARFKISQLPNMVHPGVWFEIHNGEGAVVRRLKLSVILTDVARLIFVDRKGIKVIEKDAAQFTQELSDNKSRFIADHSTFDHALGQVIHALAA